MSKKLIISKEELYDLYINQNMTLLDIAKKFGYKSRKPVFRLVKEYGIKKPMELIVNKRKETCLNKYGVENPLQSDEIRNKMKETCLKKYGVEYALQSEKVKNKCKETLLNKYGVEHPMQLDEVKDKIKETCLKNYGVENPLQSEEVKNKIKETCLNKYGVENPSQSDDIKKKKKETTLKNYGVENPSQSDEIRNKMKETCLNKYGVEYALQSEEFRNKMKETCLKKYEVEHPNQKHIKNYEIWNDDKLFYKWVKNKSNELNRKICSGDVVEFFNVNSTTALPKLHLLDDIKGSDKYYNIKESYYENLIEDWLKTNNINYKRCDRTIIKPYELDFVLPDYKIAIEMNDTWSHNIQSKMEYDNYNYLDALYYHEKKLKLAKNAGYFLVHLYDYDLGDLDSILNFYLNFKVDDLSSYELESNVYWVKNNEWLYSDDVVDLTEEGYVMMVVSNWLC